MSQQAPAPEDELTRLFQLLQSDEPIKPVNRARVKMMRDLAADIMEDEDSL